MRDRSFTQLWPEEEESLFHLGARVPAGAVVVDIGTAQGGSSFLIANGAEKAGRGIQIFTYDPKPSKEAYERLKDWPVKIVPDYSVSGAKKFADFHAGKVHLIFIDGSHTAKDVFQDIQYWWPHVHDGGVLAFHDFDPPHRGGIPHCGVNIVLEGLLRSGWVRQLDRVGRILVCQKQPSADFNGDLLLQQSIECFQLFNKRLSGEARNIENAYWVSPGNPASAKSEALICRLRKIPLLSLDRDSSQKPGIAFVRAEGSPSGAEAITEAGFLHWFQSHLSDYRDAILAECLDRRSFFRWEECLGLLWHAGQAKRPANLEDLSASLALATVEVNLVRQLTECV